MGSNEDLGKRVHRRRWTRITSVHAQASLRSFVENVARADPALAGLDGERVPSRLVIELIEWLLARLMDSADVDRVSAQISAIALPTLIRKPPPGNEGDDLDRFYAALTREERDALAAELEMTGSQLGKKISRRLSDGRAERLKKNRRM